MIITARHWTEDTESNNIKPIGFYRHYAIVDYIPEGFREARAVGSPLFRHIVLINKSPSLGGRHILYKVCTKKV